MTWCALVFAWEKFNIASPVTPALYTGTMQAQISSPSIWGTPITHTSYSGQVSLEGPVRFAEDRCRDQLQDERNESLVNGTVAGLTGGQLGAAKDETAKRINCETHYLRNTRTAKLKNCETQELRPVTAKTDADRGDAASPRIPHRSPVFAVPAFRR